MKRRWINEIKNRMHIFWTQGERPLKQIDSHKRIKKKFQQQNKDHNKEKIIILKLKK